MNHLLVVAITFIAVVGEANAQSSEESAVMAANNAFYTGLSSGYADMDKLWANKDYVAFAGPRHTTPLIGWSAIEPYFKQRSQAVGSLKVKPADVHVRVNGNSAWIISREIVEEGAKMKDGTPISSRPTISTNIFEKTDGKWLMVAHHAQEPSQ